MLQCCSVLTDVPPAAYVPYCSSDCYTGTKAASAATQGFNFHGHYIVRAIVADLLENTWTSQAEEVTTLS